MFRIPKFEVIVFTDPLCSWCWGSEPILKKLETRFPKLLKISYIMGGLVEDIRNYRDDELGNCCDIENANKSIAKHWLESSSTHKMPISIDGFKLFSDKFYSSYPANIAYHSAKIQSEKLANKYLRRLREAALTEAAQITNKAVLIELASDVGLKIGSFIQRMEDGTAERRFEEDLLFTRTNKINGFPSYLIRNNFNGKSLILRGYQDYSSFKEVLDFLSDEEIEENIQSSIPENLINFLQKEVKITPIELQTVFDLSEIELNKQINLLKENGYITIDKIGTGSFIYYLGKALNCDPITGVCYY